MMPMEIIFDNRRGAGAIGIAMTVSIIGSLLVGSLLVLSGIQRRAGLAGAAGQLSKDASVGGAEIMNQLITSKVIQAYDAQYPPVDADCVTKKSCNTTYLKAPGQTGGGGAGGPMNWFFVPGFVMSSGAGVTDPVTGKFDDSKLAKLLYRACTPLAVLPTDKVAIENDMNAVFRRAATLPGVCATIDTIVYVSDAKSGVFLELEARAP